MQKIVFVFMVLVLSFGSALAGPDEDGIRAVMKGTWDKPDAKVEVSPIAISGDHAIAGWTQGDVGGRALLRRQHGHWIVVLCAGDDLLKADALKLAGVAPGRAAELLSRNVTAEQGIPAARRAQFSKFEGLVTMDVSGAHPPQSGNGAHGTSVHQSHK